MTTDIQTGTSRLHSNADEVGVSQTIGFEREISNSVETALAIIIGDPGDLTAEAPLVRAHSQCERHYSAASR